MSSVDNGAENGPIDFIWGLARLPGWDDRAGLLHVVNLHKGGRHVAEVSFLWQQEKRMCISLFGTSFDHQPSSCVCAEQWGDSLESSVLGDQQQGDGPLPILSSVSSIQSVPLFTGIIS